MKKKYYVTTPIYYASGRLTVGHCYCSVLTDVVARFYRLNDYDVFFLTGSDEHGLKISRKAKEAGLTEKEFVDKIVEQFKNVFSKLHISYDKFIRTTDKDHEALVEKVYKKLFEKGDIYLSRYEGLYCVPCETFFTESQLVDGNCPDCGRPVELFSEESYFLKLSKYQKFLEQYFEEHKDFLTPENRKNEMLSNFIKPGLTDLCVSRTNFDWGVRLPFDKKHVAYVWIDALLNYVSALGYGSDNDELFKKYWPADVHFVGRDIARFHAIIWPILLHILDIPLPKKIHSTGFITQKGERISKSKNSGFDPVFLVDRYGADALRYHLIKTGPLNYDAPYTAETFINTINSDLCNDLGNLVSRTCAMTTQYFNAIVPAPNEFLEQDSKLINSINALYSELVKDFESNDINSAIDRVMSIVRNANRYIDATSPWNLNKTEEGKERLKTVMYVLNETLRNVAIALKPFLVEMPTKIFEKLGITNENYKMSDIKFTNNNFGNTVTKGEPLFKRLDVQAELKCFEEEDLKGGTVETQNEVKQEEVKKGKDIIEFDAFEKVELKVGTILDSVKVEGSDKLLKNTVKIGSETRTIVSGIAKTYNSQDIIGKQVVVVTNLAPRKLKGIVSEGMILCAYNDQTQELALISPIKNVEDGCEVS